MAGRGSKGKGGASARGGGGGGGGDANPFGSATGDLFETSSKKTAANPFGDPGGNLFQSRSSKPRLDPKGRTRSGEERGANFRANLEKRSTKALRAQYERVFKKPAPKGRTKKQLVNSVMNRSFYSSQNRRDNRAIARGRT